jgi:hypothetical protein
VNINALANVSIRYAEFYQLGSATANKRGIDVATTTGNFNFQYNSIHDFIVANSQGINVSSVAGSNINVSNNVFYNINNNHFINVATTGVQTINNNLFIYGKSNILSFGDVGCIFNNNNMVGAAASGLSFSETNLFTGNYDNNVIHSGNGIGISITNFLNGTISGWNIWRSLDSEISPSGLSNVTFNNFNYFGNTSKNFNVSSNRNINLIFSNSTFNSDSIFSSPNCIGNSSIGYSQQLTFISCSSGVSSGIKTNHTSAEISLTSKGRLNLIYQNCTLSGSPIIALSQLSNMTSGSFISLQKTNGINMTYKPEGLITEDNIIYDGASAPSVKLTPITGAGAFLQSGRYLVPVNSGSTCTVSIKMRESVLADGYGVYNGQFPRLFVEANNPMGIINDTFLNSASAASVGSWETVTGTTAAVTDDGILSFYVDCGGSGFTTGSVNIDTFSSTTINDTKGMKYWHDGLPSTFADNTSGSGGGGATNRAGTFWL